MASGPAVNNIGTLSRAALKIPQTALAVPTLTCTITAGMRPVTMAQLCAIDTARFSWAASTGRGIGAPVRAALAKASTNGAKSVPALANSSSTPRSRKRVR
jgi:hypothetical protein